MPASKGNEFKFKHHLHSPVRHLARYPRGTRLEEQGETACQNEHTLPQRIIELHGLNPEETK
jgi:hypothetical protein